MKLTTIFSSADRRLEPRSLWIDSRADRLSDTCGDRLANRCGDGLANRRRDRVSHTHAVRRAYSYRHFDDHAHADHHAHRNNAGAEWHPRRAAELWSRFDGERRSSRRSRPNSTTNYIVSVTNNLDPDGTDDVPYSGIPFGSDPEVDVNGLPNSGTTRSGASADIGNVVGDFLMVTISPASGGNAGGVGYYGESTTVTAPTCPVVPTPTPSASPSASPSPTGCVPNPEQGYTGSCETPPVVTVTTCDGGGNTAATGGAISWSGADGVDSFWIWPPGNGAYPIVLYEGSGNLPLTPTSGSYGPLAAGAYTYQFADNTNEIFNGSFTILTCALPNA